MISLERSSIQAKSSEREAIASACERFIRDGGKIVAVPGIEVRYDSPHAWNRNDMALPGSSQNTRDHNADAALAQRIKEIVAKGGGISSMRVTLQVDPSRIKRVAKAFEDWFSGYGLDPDAYMARTFESQRGAARDEWRDSHYACELGLPAEIVAQLSGSSGGYGDYIEPVPYRFVRLSERDDLQIGEHSWRVIIGRGHSPEHICLYNKALNILIAGDQALPKVSANVGVIGTEPEANPMYDWLASMAKLRHLPHDVLVLPSHNAPYYGLLARLAEIESYQFERLSAALLALKQPLTAYELMPVLYKKTLHGEQLMMAVAECLAHIRYLQAEGKIKRLLLDGCVRYQAVSA